MAFERSRVAALILAVALVLGIVGHVGPSWAETRPSYGGSIRVPLLGAPATLDPVAATTHADVTLVGLLFDTLYRIGARGTGGRMALKPHVAIGMPEVSEDGLTVTIRLRRDIAFHDGRPLKSADVAASLSRLAASANGWLLAPVRDIETVVLAPLEPGMMVLAATVEEAALQDPTLPDGAGSTDDVDGRASADVGIRLHLRAPVANIALRLAAPQTAITPGGRPPVTTAGRRARAARRRAGRRAAGGAIVGSGPFRLGTYDRRRGRIVLRADAAHFAGRPYLDRLELRWFEGRDAEAMAYEVGDLAASFRGAVAFVGHRPKFPTDETAGPATILVYLGFGNRLAPHWPGGRAPTSGRPSGTGVEPQDERTRLSGASTGRAAIAARHAISMALTRTALRGIGTGEDVAPTVDPVPAALSLAPSTRAPELLEAQPQRARQLWRQAQRLDPEFASRASHAGPGLTILVDRSRPDDREVAENVSAALFALGANARIVEQGPHAFAQRVRRGDCDLYIGQLALPIPTDAAALAAALAVGYGRNRARAATGEASGASGASNASGASGANIAELRRAFMLDLPIVPLFHRALRVHHRRDIRGLLIDDGALLDWANIFVFRADHPEL